MTDHLTLLALAAAQGDDRALADLVRLTQDRVRRLCAHLGSVADADDLTQETYLRALRTLPGFRGDAPVEVWLLSIARHVCADHVRRKMRRGAIDRRLAEREQPTLPDHSGDVWALVDGLDADQREAFVLTQVLGLSYQEAAEVCGCPIGTIRSRVARARVAILAQLDAGERDATA
ncbi:MAG: sigma-70 family RNA polymerase sigma factor [Microthrixaceae bacterium]